MALDFTPDINHKFLKLCKNVQRKIPNYLILDTERYIRVIKCLVQNSIDNTQKGSITVSVKLTEVDLEGNQVLITHIDDTGVGIRKEDGKKLFKFFGKVDKKLKSTTLGIGLGL